VSNTSCNYTPDTINAYNSTPEDLSYATKSGRQENQYLHLDSTKNHISVRR
jgi:hypothetical protein